MLIAFSVENYCSFNTRQTLSMEASNDSSLHSSNVQIKGDLPLLKSAGIYGANASGKSNLIEGIRNMRSFVLHSARDEQISERIDVEPFLLQEKSAVSPTLFECEFVLEQLTYRYGFVFDSLVIHSEWLTRRHGTSKEATLFKREGQLIKFSPKNFSEGAGRVEFVRPNALFLSLCSQLNGPISGSIVAWFGQMTIISGLNDQGFLFTAQQLQDDKQRLTLTEFAQKADLNISGLKSQIEELKYEQLIINKDKVVKTDPASRKTVFSKIPKITTTHILYSEKGRQTGTVEFDLKKQESQGTLKFIALSGPLHRAITQNSVIIVDEFDARLHPHLTRELLRWFHSENESSAQLIFATHDVGLMEPDLLRRDQVWFCQKDKKGATQLYSLEEFDSAKIRPTTRFSRHYMQGLLGAIPSLSLLKEAGRE